MDNEWKWNDAAWPRFLGALDVAFPGAAGTSWEVRACRGGGATFSHTVGHCGPGSYLVWGEISGRGYEIGVYLNTDDEPIALSTEKVTFHRPITPERFLADFGAAALRARDVLVSTRDQLHAFLTPKTSPVTSHDNTGAT
jgi:hypothetical protein